MAYKKGEEFFHKYGIVIWTGRPGCGKTQAADHLILKQFINKDTNCIFTIKFTGGSFVRRRR